MPARDPESSPAVFLGKELQRARSAAAFKSQDALAARLGFDRTVITKAESGARPRAASRNLIREVAEELWKTA